MPIEKGDKLPDEPDLERSKGWEHDSHTVSPTDVSALFPYCVVPNDIRLPKQADVTMQRSAIPFILSRHEIAKRKHTTGDSPA